MSETFKGLLEIFAKLPLWMYFLVISAVILTALSEEKGRKKYYNNKKFYKNKKYYKQYNSQDREPTWRKFEKEIASAFKQNGWDIKLGPGYDDGGKDIIVRRGLETYVVQCKHYYGNRFVSPSQIRDFQGAIDLYERENNMTVRGIFITSGKTTSKARETAKMLHIKLWDNDNWRDMINNL